MQRRKQIASATVCALLLLSLLPMPAGLGEAERDAAGRMDRTKLNIGAYILAPYARSEAHIRDIADCGIDFIEDMEYDPEALELFGKYGLGAIVCNVVPGWWGGTGENAGQFAVQNPMSEYEAAAEAFTDQPAIWGIDVGDEPSALDFPQYGKVIRRVEELFPNQFAFLNLHPYYAQEFEHALGTPTYEEYIAEYCRNVDTDYICYDFYVYSDTLFDDYENLRIVSDACRNEDRSMWVVLQVNSLDPEHWISLNELRFQAYTALAFGAETILWSCYTEGWWEHNVLDRYGNKTGQYEKLKQMNSELHTLSDRYMRYRNTGTHFVGFDGRRLASRSTENFSNDRIGDVHAWDGRALLVGEMTARSGEGAALFVCACDDPYDVEPTATSLLFRTSGEVHVYGGNGSLPVTQTADGAYAVEITSNQGILIELS